MSEPSPDTALQPRTPGAAPAPAPRRSPVSSPASRVRGEAAWRALGRADLFPPAAGPGILPQRRRGRGAASNESGRYETERREAFDDGWESLEELPRLKTEVTIERPRKIITRNASPDISFDRSINPYRGCEHGCAYCFARPTHAYMGLSPGLDFETRLFAKPDAARLLEKELAAPGYQVKTIAIGTNTDPYQPIERHYRIMRQVLEVLAEANHPVGIVTKSALVLRDLDILGPMAEKGLAKVGISLTTLDRKLARAMEPRASAPEKRLKAIAGLAEAGVPVAVMTAPVVPAVNDAEIEKLLEAGSAAGASSAGYVLLRLPLEVAPLFTEWLRENFPDRAEHVLSVMRGMRGGKDYDAAWGERMRGSGPYAWQIGRRFELACRRLGLNVRRDTLRTDLFTPPVPVGGQLKLL
ncbi:PA0069 family radical SAM protein [Afifella pfennigii]|uniref:PA0069 family radical SAM protein n=1 Tax=Afifella pfennigii TaxID=209897 RepID=UPI0009FC9F38|nr:PA0069 family radical SAM protein [Afifella pfennigii]